MYKLELLACFHIFIHIFIFVDCDDSGATIVFKPNNPKEDAKVLNKAMVGWGTTEKNLINILAARTGAQRQAISAMYAHEYKRTLINDLESDTSGTFEDVLVDLTYSVEEFLAREINWSLHKKGEWAFIDIICTCDGKQLQSIKVVYNQVFKVSLPSDIENKVSYVPTRVLLLRILSGFDLPYRDADTFEDKTVKSYLKSIPEKKEDCRLDLNGPFFTLMSKESFRQIQTVVRQYNGEKDNKDHPVTARIIEFCEDESLKRAYTTIVSYSDDPAKYFASVLKVSMKGLGTTERDLNRIIIWRSEIDLIKIMTAFQDLTHKSLESWVKGDTSGDYENVLVKIIKGNRK